MYWSREGFSQRMTSNKTHESVQITKLNHNNQQARGSSSRGLVPNLVRYCRWVNLSYFKLSNRYLLTLWYTFFYERRFLVNGTSFPPPPWYTFWYVIHYHVLHLPCKGSCVSQRGTASYKKTFKTLYSLIQKHNEKHKNLVEYDLVHIYSPDTKKYDAFSTQ